MTQSTADLIVMMILEKSLIKDVKMGELHKLERIFSLSLQRGRVNLPRYKLLQMHSTLRARSKYLRKPTAHC